MATRRNDGSAAVLLWNLIPASEGGDVANGNPIGATGGSNKQKGQGKSYRLKLSGLEGHAQVAISQVNGQVGTAIPKWQEIGSPKYPSAGEIAQLRAAAELPKPEMRSLAAGAAEFSIELPPNGVALLEFTK
jgi:hypothetical protein